MNITYDKFEKYMKHIVAFEEMQSEITMATSKYNNFTGDYADFGIPSTTFDTVELLSIVCDDTSGWIEYWVYELDCGREYKEGMIKSKNGSIIALQTIEDLWNLLSSK